MVFGHGEVQLRATLSDLVPPAACPHSIYITAWRGAQSQQIGCMAASRILYILAGLFVASPSHCIHSAIITMHVGILRLDSITSSAFIGLFVFSERKDTLFGILYCLCHSQYAFTPRMCAKRDYLPLTTIKRF